MSVRIGRDLAGDTVTFRTQPGMRIPANPFGMKYKPSIKTGTVRVTRWMLVSVIDEMMQHLPRDKFDLTSVEEILADYDKDVVLEVGLPSTRKSMVTNIRNTDNGEVAPEGGLWITVDLKEVKEVTND